MFQAAGFCSLDIDLEIVRGTILLQDCVEGNALDINGMALHAVPARPRGVKRAKHISLVVDPEKSTSRPIPDSNLLDYKSLGCNLLAKSLSRVLHENGIGFDRNNIVSLG